MIACIDFVFPIVNIQNTVLCTHEYNFCVSLFCSEVLLFSWLTQTGRITYAVLPPGGSQVNYTFTQRL